jgi:hypothetical protein
MVLRSDSSSRWVLLACTVAVLFAGYGSQSAAAQPDVRFGVVEAYAAPAAASQAGVAWERVRFHWAEIQAGGEGSWNSGDLTDDLLGRELSAGRQLVGLLIGIPDWANENGIPRGLELPHTDPRNTWATFVRTVVARYAGRIDHWILWNEPDVWDANHAGHTWGGSVNDFVQLTRVGYVTAKETNPQAVVHLAAVTHWWDAAYGRQLYFQRFLEALVADSNAAGNNYYFDVATLHLYFQPQFVFDLTSYYYGLMGSYGIWKPIWIVETNAAPSMDPAWPVAQPRFHISLDEQAAYMPQALALGLAAGAQRIAIYKLMDTPGDAAANPEPFGLIRADGSPRPAFSTYRVATQLLNGAGRTTRDRWDDIGLVTVEQPGGTTTVLFSRVPGPRVAQVPAFANTAVLVDMWGNRQTVTAQDGSFAVQLPAAPCSQSAGDYCIIGGPTFYLVQGHPGGHEAISGTLAPVTPDPAAPAEPAATQPPTFSPSATRTVTASPSRTPSPTGTPSSPNTVTPTNTGTNTPVVKPSGTSMHRLTTAPTTRSPSRSTEPTPFVVSPAPTPLPDSASLTNTRGSVLWLLLFTLVLATIVLLWRRAH